MHEVFFLAYHLHWSRQDILDLGVPERLGYVEMLKQQLKREEQAMKPTGGIHTG